MTPPSFLTGTLVFHYRNAWLQPPRYPRRRRLATVVAAVPPWQEQERRRRKGIEAERDGEDRALADFGDVSEERRAVAGSAAVHFRDAALHGLGELRRCLDQKRRCRGPQAPPAGLRVSESSGLREALAFYANREQWK